MRRYSTQNCRTKICHIFTADKAGVLGKQGRNKQNSWRQNKANGVNLFRRFSKQVDR